jgi:hypothetical protein
MSMLRKKINRCSLVKGKSERKRPAAHKDSGSLVQSLIEKMREYKETTVKIAEELGFEHRDEPTADQVRRYLANTAMDVEDYALVNTIGGKLNLCLSIAEELRVSDDRMREARELASFAYSTV